MDEKVIARFLAKVERRSPEECWEWTGATNRGGYGEIRDANRRKIGAHRVSHFIATGELPECVCHRCDNPRCVNPAHLFGGSIADNIADCKAKGRTLKHERNTWAKLTWAEADAIRASVLPTRLLTRRFGVGVTTIKEIRSGRRWAR